MKLNTYGSFKNSDVEWLGEIPQHWEVDRIKSLFNQISNKGNVLKENTYIPLENIESFTGRILKLSSNENGEETVLFKKEDLLFNKLRPYLGKVLIAEFDGGVSGEVIVNRVQNLKKRSVFNRYYFYRLLSTHFVFKVNSLSDGVKMPRANPVKISALEVPLPPISEQKAIALFLDQKTEAIDKKTSLLKKKIRYYKELSKSIINEAVCRGLKQNVLLKDSGIQWIGKIPEHWEIKRVQELFQERSEKVSDTIFPPLSVSMNGIVPQMEGTAKTKNNDDRKKVLKGDFLINSRSDRRGASGLSEYRGSVSVISIVLKVNKNVSGKYYHHFFRSYSFTEEFYKSGKGIVDDLWATKYSVMKAMQICVPPLKEQTEIAEYLDRKTKTIEATVKNITAQIEVLKELRKTLINDVVTGKLKVTE